MARLDHNRNAITHGGIGPSGAARPLAGRRS
jgi:hypothetical protein